MPDVRSAWFAVLLLPSELGEDVVALVRTRDVCIGRDVGLTCLVRHVTLCKEAMPIRNVRRGRLVRM